VGGGRCRRRWPDDPDRSIPNAPAQGSVVLAADIAVGEFFDVWSAPDGDGDGSVVTQK
jgi:hypothetical protein